MKQYLDLLASIMEMGEDLPTRQGGKVRSLVAPPIMTYDLRDGFPLATTKKVFFKGVVEELLWFLRGDTSIGPLVREGVNIWNADWMRWNQAIQKDSLKQLIDTMRTDPTADNLGKLGKVYGYQWRNFGGSGEEGVFDGTDQIKEVLKSLREDPYGRRHIVSAWNASELDQMALPPCHVLFQFFRRPSAEGAPDYLDLIMYQRSADTLLGVPFNIASYSLLLMLVANELSIVPRNFKHVIGDAHVYHDHFDAVRKQLTRTPKDLPIVEITRGMSVLDIRSSDIVLVGYEPLDAIKAPLIV